MFAYAKLSKADKKRLRDEMLKQARTVLDGLYKNPAQLTEACAVMVDSALAKEATR